MIGAQVELSGVRCPPWMAVRQRVRVHGDKVAAIVGKAHGCPLPAAAGQAVGRSFTAAARPRGNDGTCHV